MFAGDLDIGAKRYDEAGAIEAEYEARFGTQHIRLKADDDKAYEIPLA